MKIRFGITMQFVSFSGLVLFTYGLLSQQITIHAAACNATKISWQQPFNSDGATLIPGAVRTANGSLRFYWKIDADGRMSLVILTAAGGGELPPREERLLLLARENGTAVLFQEWFPLANVRKPPTIRPVATVSTRDLFSVLPAGVAPPPAPPLPRKAARIEWRPIIDRDGIRYLTGLARNGRETVEIAWRKAPGRRPELVMLAPFEAGELPPVPIKLYIWDGQARGIAALCLERQHLLNQKFVPSLQCLARVRTAELMSGFERADRDGGTG